MPADRDRPSAKPLADQLRALDRVKPSAVTVEQAHRLLDAQRTVARTPGPKILAGAMKAARTPTRPRARSSAT